LKTTVQIGVLSAFLSFWVQLSEPGATPGQIFTTCESAEHAIRNVMAIPPTARTAVRIILPPNNGTIKYQAE
jgi:hypothetical protein